MCQIGKEYNDKPDVINEIVSEITKLVTVSEKPGQGKVKSIVDDAPLDLSNSVLRDLLNEYGKVLDVRNQYLFVGGNQVPWWNGTRQIDMCIVKLELPPTLNVSHGHREVKIKIWHQGQKRIRDERNCPREARTMLLQLRELIPPEK